MPNKTTQGSKKNPRYKNGNLRRKHRARLKAQGGPCGICNGRFGEIHYDEPSNWKHPLSFVVDEIIPVSRWKEYGYESPEAAAQDWNNLQPAHYCCNQAKSNKIIGDAQKPRGIGQFEAENNQKPVKKQQIIAKINLKDGDW